MTKPTLSIDAPDPAALTGTGTAYGPQNAALETLYAALATDIETLSVTAFERVKKFVAATDPGILPASALGPFSELVRRVNARKLAELTGADPAQAPASGTATAPLRLTIRDGQRAPAGGNLVGLALAAGALWLALRG